MEWIFLSDSIGNKYHHLIDNGNDQVSPEAETSRRENHALKNEMNPANKYNVLNLSGILQLAMIS